MSIKGAGGSEGGIGRFFIGLIMFIAGGYLFLNAVQVTNSFGFGYGLFALGGYQVTSGFVLIPFMIGIGMIFFNSSSYMGWLLTIISMILFVFGIITSTHFSLRPMTAFELITIIVLMAGGLGLFFSSFRNYSK
jgi:hypothetical protein